LHSVWDGVMVKQAGRTPEAYANYLEKEWLQGRDLAALSMGTATEWALASRVLGESAIVPQESALGVSYYEQFVPIVDQQLALAGIRLARILNEAFR
ncbi:MAG: S1/P1 nuclease, partial [Bradyrhizobium sp.]